MNSGSIIQCLLIFCTIYLLLRGRVIKKISNYKMRQMLQSKTRRALLSRLLCRYRHVLRHGVAATMPLQGESKKRLTSRVYLMGHISVPSGCGTYNSSSLLPKQLIYYIYTTFHPVTAMAWPISVCRINGKERKSQIVWGSILSKGLGKAEAWPQYFELVMNFGLCALKYWVTWQDQA